MTSTSGRQEERELRATGSILTSLPLVQSPAVSTERCHRTAPMASQQMEAWLYHDILQTLKLKHCLGINISY